jgi:hypothetical protein
MAETGSAPSPPSPPQESAPPASALPPAATTPSDIQASGSGVAAVPIPAPTFAGNVAQLDFGGTVETAVSFYAEPPDMGRLLDGDAGRALDSFGDAVKEIVLSFFAREPMLVDAVVFRSGAASKTFPRDVEVLVSSAAEPNGRFTKVAAAALPEANEASVPFAPVEARFVKVRLLSSQSGKQAFSLSELQVHEAQRAGYVPLMTRHPELGLTGGAVTLPGGPPTVSTGPPPCAPQSPEARLQLPAHSESNAVLVVSPPSVYVPAVLPGYFADPRSDDGVSVSDRAFLRERVRFRQVAPEEARPALLAPAYGFDTVALAQVCNIKTSVSAAFKQALMTWVAAGHKLIIQDADRCTPGPDYSFLPYKFKTDNPGAQGAAGKGLAFIESNTMLQGLPGRPGFLDVKAWERGIEPYYNELGDSNTLVEWDAHWCGQLTVRSVNNVSGFVLAYAHYGRGLIIYEGFDNQQNRRAGYDLVVVRELAQGFDPDNLPCGARLGDFVVSTDASLLYRVSKPGQTYAYPLSLLSNLFYKGTVSLAVKSRPGVEGIRATVDPPSVALAGEGQSTLTVTLPAGGAAAPQAIEVTGTDAAGKTNSLCLQLGPLRSGELSVVSALSPPTKTRKNLEIILDASGSMKTLMGKKTRWDVALDTLQQVLAKLPDDFNVGLRMYGHREASTSPKTCTDSELLVPIEKLNRQNVLERAKAFKPKGETPLVYSALQAPADLKSVGGGTVVLITDGEESCKGDAVKAAADLKASGLDLRLNIVGFAVTNPKTQKDLAGFSQATGGMFYAAQSGEALADALLVAAIEKFPYTVYDAAGKAVVSGEAGGGADALPPGDYKVVVKAGARDIVAPRVTIGLGQAVTLKIAMKNGQLVIE